RRPAPNRSALRRTMAEGTVRPGWRVRAGPPSVSPAWSDGGESSQEYLRGLGGDGSDLGESVAHALGRIPGRPIVAQLYLGGDGHGGIELPQVHLEARIGDQIYRGRVDEHEPFVER